MKDPYEVTVEAAKIPGMFGATLTVIHDGEQVEDVTLFVEHECDLPDLLESLEEQKRRLIEAYNFGLHDAISERDPTQGSLLEEEEHFEITPEDLPSLQALAKNRTIVLDVDVVHRLQRCGIVDDYELSIGSRAVLIRPEYLTDKGRNVCKFAVGGDLEKVIGR